MPPSSAAARTAVTTRLHEHALFSNDEVDGQELTRSSITYDLVRCHVEVSASVCVSIESMGADDIHVNVFVYP